MFINLKIGGGIAERSDLSARFYNDIKKYPVLTTSEEKELFKTLRYGTSKDAEAARERLIVCNQRYVVAIAKRLHTNGIELVDLINEGNLGLIEAISKYNPNKDSKLSSYAVYYIKRNIDQFKLNNLKVVKKKSWERIYHSMAKVGNKLSQELGREPSADELAEEISKKLNMDIKDSSDVKETKIISIDTEIDTDDTSDATQCDIMEYNNCTSVNNEFNLTSNVETNNYTLNKLLGCLTDRERKIVELNFGIGLSEEERLLGGYDYNDIAIKLGMTPERVRQIKSLAVKKLQGIYNRNKEAIVASL